MRNQDYILTSHRISKEQKKKAIKLGKGNESRGIRLAIDSYKLPVKSETVGDYKVEIKNA